MISELNGHEVTSVGLLIRVWRDLANPEPTKGMVSHCPRVLLVALVFDGPGGGALIVPDLAIFHQEVIHPTKRRRAHTEVTGENFNPVDVDIAAGHLNMPSARLGRIHRFN